MKKYWSFKNRMIYNAACLSLRSQLSALSSQLITDRSKFFTLISYLFALCLVVGWVLYPGMANSGSYLVSAHGSSEYGVKRNAIGFPSDYTRGLCAHCHEQHESIGGKEPQPEDGHPSIYLLLSDFVDQLNVPCFDCHTETKQLQDPTGPMNLQYSYSHKAGGDANACPNNINRAFAFITSDCTLSRAKNCDSSVGSAHCLKDIAIFLKNKVGFNSAAANNDPCSGCHNPHKAKREFPCSKPSAHTDKYAWDVWGDDVGEKINDYPFLKNSYLPPKKAGGGYEPDGSILPDYASLCTDCHSKTTNIWSTRLGRNLYHINWDSGDFHGVRLRIDNGDDFFPEGEFGDLLEPYKSGGKFNYVLSCTDCHEPHGSPNEFLLRPTLNGNGVNATHAPSGISGGKWYYWCQACHSINLPFTPSQHLPPVDPTTNCFNAGACHRHCDGTACSSHNLF